MSDFDVVIDKLCQKFGVTVEYLMPRMISYYKAEAVANALMALLVVLISFLVIRMVLKKCKKEDVDITDTFLELFVVVLSGAIFAIALAICCCCVCDLVKVFISPEFYAISHLIGELK